MLVEAIEVNRLDITEFLESLNDVLSGDILADVEDPQRRESSCAAATGCSLECTRDLFERLGSNINAVQVGLEDVWIHIAQVHWLCSIPCDPLRLTCCREEFGSLGEDVGVDREALRVSGQLPNADVESGSEVMST